MLQPLIKNDMSWINEMKCDQCGAASMSGFVQYASYFARRAVCGSDCVTTTWLVYARQIEGNFSAYLVEPSVGTNACLAEGDISQIADTVTNAAKLGKLVQLKKIVQTEVTRLCARRSAVLCKR